jgi:2-polyprenyl-3-methyl-5-hydroxy-6-metoxy-1,4-benzoquinol methylase
MRCAFDVALSWPDIGKRRAIVAASISISRRVALVAPRPQDSEMYDDEKFRSSLATAERSIAALAGQPSSRMYWPGRFAKRMMRRLLRFVLSPQLDFDDAVRVGLHAAGDGLAAQRDQLQDQSRRLDELGAVVPAKADQLQDQSRRLDELGAVVPAQSQQLEEQSQRIDELGAAVERLAAVSSENTDGLQSSGERIGGLEVFLAELIQDINTDFTEIRAVEASMGRQIDEVGGELVANTIDVQKLRKRLDGLKLNVASDQKHASDRIRTLEKRFEPLIDLDHFDFAKSYRGDEVVIRTRLEKYAHIYGPVTRILDFGCGRGEFLLVCSELDIGAYGVDRDADMISHCKLQKLEAIQGDAMLHLEALPARSLDGIFSAQVVEHLTPAEIVQLIQLASEKLKRGGKIIIETINPNTWSAMRWFYLDPSHSQPVPADMLRFFLEEANFEILDILYSSPVAKSERLNLMEADTQLEDSTLANLLEQNNENVQRLNDLLFGPQDFAIVAER